MLSLYSTDPQWLSVKLAKKYSILRVIILTRANYRNSFLGLKVFVGNAAGLDQPLCGEYVDNVSIHSNQLVAVSCACSMSGTQVTINPIVDAPKSAGILRVAVFGIDLDLI